MARRTPPPAPPALPLTLGRPRPEIAGRIRERIELGRQMQSRSMHRGEDVEAFKNGVDKWDEFNAELLKQIFSNETVSEEYKYSNGGFVGNLNDPPMMNTYRLYKETLDSRLNKLESIFERLELYPEPASTSATTFIASPKRDLSTVFVVHGHDGEARLSIARFIEQLGFEAIILHERPNKGRTIITKFREEAADVGFAVVLMTPDDVGGVPGLVVNQLVPRARQNVVFELGFFIGALGPERVAALVKGHIERPSDFDGVVYISLDDGGWKMALGRELQAAGYDIDWNKVMRA